MRYFFFFFVVLSFAKTSFGLSPITPRDVLSSDEIEIIQKTKNFFLYRDLDLESLIWTKTKRKYGSHFLGPRKFLLSEEDIIHRTLVEGFSLEYQLETLYRDKMKLHGEIGGVIPHLNFSFGSGVDHGLSKVFGGLFGFLLPSHWMRIANQKRLYKVSYYTLAKSFFDEVMKAKIAYVDLHQELQEFETLNYYFIHMEILGQSDPELFGPGHLIQAISSAMATEMAEKRSEIRHDFNELASTMGLEYDDRGLAASRLNIEDMKDFPSEVDEILDFDESLKTKESFLKKVLEKSIELKIVKELYKVSKLNIGIEASGGTTSTDENAASSRSDPSFNLSLGYGTIPNILESVSEKRTARIDVRNEYIKMLTHAREAYDSYINAKESYTEAKKALKENRKSFKINLQKLIDGKDHTGGLPTLLGSKFLMGAEFSLTHAFHDFLKAKINMERYLLVGFEDYLKYLPKREKILKSFEKSKIDFDKRKLRKTECEKDLEDLRSSTVLEKLLTRKPSKFDRFFTEKRERELKELIQTSLDELLKKRVHLVRRRKKFFQVLDKYIRKNHIYMTSDQRHILDERLGKEKV